MRVVRVPSDQVVPVPAEVTDGPAVVAAADPSEPPDYPLVMVTWHDAYFELDQESADDCRPDYLVHTVGFLVSDGPRFVSVAQEVLPDGDGFRAVTHVPTSIVERIVPLLAAPQGLASTEPA